MKHLKFPLPQSLEPTLGRAASPVANGPGRSSAAVAVGNSVSGMGAIVLAEGVAFRVWAPHAEKVSVVGSFNGWDEDAHPLTREDGDTWFGLVPNAQVGDEYRYALKTGEQTLSRIDPRAKKVTNSVGNGVVWSNSRKPKPFTPPTLDQLVIYELHIGSFHSKGEGQPGTFASAIEKLDYIKDLGVNAIEVMPVAEFAGDFSWGYNPAHPYAVESAYGGPDAFMDFIEAAHERGLAVILDVVFNHFGPSDLGLWQFDGWSENGQGGIYFYNDWRANTPWGDTRPDYGRGEVRSYIHDNVMMWLEEFGVDGLRWDMAVYIRTYRGNPDDPMDDLKEGWGMLQWLNREIAQEYPNAIRIAEDLRDSEWLVKDVESGGAGFLSQWDGAFVHPVREGLIVAEDAHRNMDALVLALKHRYGTDAFRRVIYSESHDEVANGKARLPSEIGGDDAAGYYARKRSVLGAVLVMTAPGTPMLFQGQEFLEDEWFRDEVPLDWSKLERFAGVNALYRDLVTLRLNRHGTTLGLSGHNIAVHHVNHADKVVGYCRSREGGPGDVVLVILNFSANVLNGYAVGVPTEGRWCVRLNTDGSCYSPDFKDTVAEDADSSRESKDGMRYQIVTNLAPYSALILSQDPS